MLSSLTVTVVVVPAGPAQPLVLRHVTVARQRRHVAPVFAMDSLQQSQGGAHAAVLLKSSASRRRRRWAAGKTEEGGISVRIQTDDKAPRVPVE